MPETLPMPLAAAEPSTGPRPRPRRRARRCAVAVVGVLALILAACGSGSKAGLTVGSRTIDQSTVNQELAAITRNSVLKAQAVKDGKLDPAAAAAWLTSVIETQVAAEAVEEAGTKITKKDREQAATWADSFFGDESAFKAFPKSFREAAVERYVSVPAYVRTHAKAPTETQLRAAYDQSIAQGCASRRFVSHILITSEEAVRAAEGELAAGDDFEQVAAKHSTDAQSAERGGGIGCIEGQQIDATFAAAAAATPIGAVSAPVQTQYGWHIIKVDDVEAAQSFDEVKSTLRDRITQQEGFSTLQKLIAKAKVKVASRYGRWVVKDGVGSVEPPKVKSSSTSTTTKASGSSTTTTTP